MEFVHDTLTYKHEDENGKVKSTTVNYTVFISNGKVAGVNSWSHYGTAKEYATSVNPNSDTFERFERKYNK